MSKFKAILLAGIIFFAVVGTGLFILFKSVTNQIFVKLIDPSGVSTNISPTPNPYTNAIKAHFAERTPFNVLLLGYGGGIHDGTYLTDSIIVAHIDPEQRLITLISLPRDLWVKFPEDGKYYKINSAYSFGFDRGAAMAGKLARDAASVVIGEPVQYFISIDFAGFIKTIDSLGGVDINVDVAFDDYQYPIAGGENDLCGHRADELPMLLSSQSATLSPETIFPCRYEHLHFDKGPTHMDGATALKYVRSRHSSQDGSDFGRSRRQKNLILAVKQKVMSVGFLSKAIPFFSSLGDDIRTDLSLDETKELMSHSSELSSYKISSLALTDENYLNNSYSPDGQFILAPKAGIDNWTEIQNYIFTSLLPPTPTPTPLPQAGI